MNRIESLFLEFVSVDFGRETNSAPFLAHVNENPGASLFDLSESLMQLRSAITPLRGEDVACEAFAMNANYRRFFRIDMAFDECEMVPFIHRRAIEVQFEYPIVRRQGDCLLSLDQFLLFSAISDQVLDAADSQPVLSLELDQLW